MFPINLGSKTTVLCRTKVQLKQSLPLLFGVTWAVVVQFCFECGTKSNTDSKTSSITSCMLLALALAQLTPSCAHWDRHLSLEMKQCHFSLKGLWWATSSMEIDSRQKLVGPILCFLIQSQTYRNTLCRSACDGMAALGFEYYSCDILFHNTSISQDSILLVVPSVVSDGKNAKPGGKTTMNIPRQLF